MPTTYFNFPEYHFEWYDVTAPSENELTEIGGKYNIHPYLLRDCLEPDHLPKFETHENIHFIISRFLTEGKLDPKVTTFQQASSKLALFYNESILITVHRLPLDFIEEVKKKYVDTHRCHFPADIVVRLLWNVLKSYETPSMKLTQEIDVYEERIFLKNLSSEMMKQLYFLKRRTNIGSKLLQITTDIILNIKSKDKIAYNDLRDIHTHLLTTYNQNLEDVNNLLHFYLSISSQKTNEVMRILTVFSAFFLPLTFIVGVYGMNFEFMPELKQKWGYPATWGAMVLVTLIIFQWFWRKKWL